MVFLLNNLWRELVVGKCLSMSCRKSRAMFVFTDLLNGGLNQIMFLRHFRFVHEEVGVVVGLQVEYSSLASLCFS